MTEKRFKLLYSQLDNGMFVDKEKQFEDVIVDKEFQKIGLIKLVDLLNNLADENEQLKSALKELKEIGDYQADRIKELDEENQQIESTIKEAYQTERTMIGKSVLKQLIDQME